MYQYLIDCKYINEGQLEYHLNSYKNYEMPVYIVDANGKYTYVNNAFLKVLNIRNEEDVAKDVELILGTRNAKYISSLKQKIIILKEKKSFNQCIYIDGKEMVWRVTSIPILDYNGDCNKCICIAKVSYKKDIYTEKSDEYGNQYNIQYSIIGDDNERKEEFIYEELYEYMQEISHKIVLDGMSIWIYDEKFKIIKKRICIGIDSKIMDGVELPFDDYQQEYMKRNCKNLFYPVPMKSYERFFAEHGFEDAYNKYLLDKYIMYMPIIYDGRVLGMLSIYLSNGHLEEEGYVLIRRVINRISLCLKNIQLLHDVTNQLSEKVKLQNTLNRYLNNSMDLCIVMDIEFNILTTSYSVIKLLGWTFEEIKQQKIHEMIISNSKKLRDVIDSNKRYNTRVYVGPCKAMCKDGSFKDLDVYYYIDTINNEIVLTGQDVTGINELKAKTKLLQSEIDKEKVKNEFITNISHEFRTPLNIILSAVQLEEIRNKNNSVDEGKIDNIALIKQNSYRILRLSNNLIDIAAINSGCMKMNYRNVNLMAYIREITKHVESFCRIINRQFSCYLDNVNITISCDKEKMEKVILNLLSNAIKFTSLGGKIGLGANVDRNSNRLYVWVKDDGCGIAEENYEKVFSSFTQVDNLLTRTTEGSGIGLALCKAFVELHNGKIYIDSSFKQGTKMVFYIPLCKLRETSTNKDSVILQSSKTSVEVEFSDIYL
ncbi:PAS fold [Hathewaya proteolytica DSM 3090]|uniref:histidine kinase n=1 Tax=Hathewaya proteolytica DSM 3090 TaxID=1121331 RepID=A0A1M6QL73_9CLOT|nr:ATP-binding protein [Hathewaya proteolytica]SHK20991.1 PAS fold [Hathewaya proteolytica DSM 3090]